jgi:hypothetical protein
MADGETPPSGQTQTPKELRDYADNQKARADQLEAKVKSMSLKGLGLDPSKGIGKAALTTYTGDFEDATALAAHLKEEYEWEPKAAEPTEQGETEGQKVGQQIAQTQERISAATGQPPPSGAGGQGATLDEQIAAAEAEGRVADGMALKTQKLLGIMNKG